MQYRVTRDPAAKRLCPADALTVAVFDCPNAEHIMTAAVMALDQITAAHAHDVITDGEYEPCGTGYRYTVDGVTYTNRIEAVDPAAAATYRLGGIITIPADWDYV